MTLLYVVLLCFYLTLFGVQQVCCSVVCNNGFQQSEGNCIRVSTVADAKSFSSAEASCGQDGAGLLSGTAQLLNLIRYQNAQLADQQRYYVGLKLITNDQGETSAKWNTGSHMVEPNWVPEGEKKSCVALQYLDNPLAPYKLFYQDCNTPQPYICQQEFVKKEKMEMIEAGDSGMTKLALDSSLILDNTRFITSDSKHTCAARCFFKKKCTDFFTEAVSGKAAEAGCMLYAARYHGLPPGYQGWLHFIDKSRWTTFLRRVSSSLTFDKTWAAYENGFGDPTENFWLGLKELHARTKFGSKMRILLTYWNDITKMAEYSQFKVGNATSKYKLTINGFFGTSGLCNALNYHNGMAFSTKDQDNDQHESNCADVFRGGFWFKACHYVNPVGTYYNQPTATNGLMDKAKGLIWRCSSDQSDHLYSLKRYEWQFQESE